MRIDMVNDVRRADYAMSFAIDAEWLLAQKSQAFSLPAARAIKLPCNRIALAIIVPVAITLLSPSNWAMDGRTYRHGLTSVMRRWCETTTLATIISIVDATLASLARI